MGRVRDTADDAIGHLYECRIGGGLVQGGAFAGLDKGGGFR